MGKFKDFLEVAAVASNPTYQNDENVWRGLYTNSSPQQREAIGRVLGPMNPKLYQKITGRPYQTNPTNFTTPNQNTQNVQGNQQAAQATPSTGQQ